MGLLKRT